MSYLNDMNTTIKKGQISRETIQIIFNSLKVALATKCDELLFDEFGVTGRAVETGIVIIHQMDNVFEFKSMGVGRVPELFSRLRLIIDDPTLHGVFEEIRENKVANLIFKTKKTTLSYRCKDPDTIKTSKKAKDPVFFTFNLNSDAIKFMTSGTSAMGNKSVSFKLKDGNILIKLLDDQGDVLEHVVTDKVKIHDVSDREEFLHSYSMPKLAPLLNAHKENTVVNITRRGLMNLSSDGFNIYLAPDTN